MHSWGFFMSVFDSSRCDAIIPADLELDLLQAQLAYWYAFHLKLHGQLESAHCSKNNWAIKPAAGGNLPLCRCRDEPRGLVNCPGHIVTTGWILRWVSV